MTTDAKLLADLNSARISALAGREAARHWCPNLDGDFDSILKGIDAAIERCQLYVGMPHPDEIIAFIIADIRDRRGIGDEWEAIDEDIRNEIIAGWRKFISGSGR